MLSDGTVRQFETFLFSLLPAVQIILVAGNLEGQRRTGGLLNDPAVCEGWWGEPRAANA